MFEFAQIPVGLERRRRPTCRHRRARRMQVLVSESIRLLNLPQDLLNIASANDLCLDPYLHPITQGQYALYQVRHQGEFAVAGLR